MGVERLDVHAATFKEGGMRGRDYAAEFRQRYWTWSTPAARSRSARPRRRRAHRGTLQVSAQTTYKWRRQDRIDRGLEPGTTSAELGGANRSEETYPRVGDRR